MNHYFTAILFTFLGSVFVLADDTRVPRRQPAIPTEINLATNGNTALGSDPLIQYLVNQTNLDSLTRHINILSGEDSVTINGSTYLILSRYAFHPHNDLAADYIFQILNSYGLPTYNQPYDSSGRNVYSVQMGTDYPEEIFIIGAHYDDKPAQPPAPGADDNASGVAMVLEAARILSQIPTPYTVIYALWDEEEIGPRGSAYYAQQAYFAGEDILGVLVLDVLGWDSNNDGLFEIHTRPIANSVELADLIYYLEDEYNLGLLPVIFNPGYASSDLPAFWSWGYTAVLNMQAGHSGDYNPFNHTSNDKISHFNLTYYYALSKLAVATISHLSFYNINIIVNLENEHNLLTADFVLKQNYPNPFNSTTTIEFNLPHPAYTSLKIYNTLGQDVSTLIAENLPAGNNICRWDAQELPGGIYFYRLETKGFTRVKKMLLIK
ncbi:MAG: M20/M25/M40 family metallo-hydrolase [Calditrichaceae bacterium]|nr:M20/M25/M40 family metallo-hydrolase [Calditrichia bacterium]NUQ40615.1 M20/M25/M40 family metallo-hydrolase [Calditrichaceae bacterium]